MIKIRHIPSVVSVLAQLMLFNTAIAVDKDQASERSAGLQQLVAYLTGSFSSARQAVKDSSFTDFRLEVIPIWLERKDAIWLYVEQASAAKLDRPYRQRIYRLSEQRDGQFVSEIYSLPDSARFAGAYRLLFLFDSLYPEQLDLRDGCSVTLRKTCDTLFVGQTTGTGCASDLRGAQYGTSEVTLGPSEMVSWDRGFDSAEKQVWGAMMSGFRFQRVKR